jgi:hypothetical protein
MQDPALGGSLALEADVLEIASVPQRVEVALNSGLIVDVTRMGEDMGANRLRRNTAVAVDFDGTDQILLSEGRYCAR